MYPSENGGPALTTFWIAKALVRQGLQVKIATTTSFTSLLNLAGKPVATDYGKVTYWGFYTPGTSLRYIFRACVGLVSEEVVVVSSFMAPSSLSVALFARLLGKKLIWSPRGELDEKAIAYGRPQKRVALWFARHFLLGSGTVIHVTSEEEAGAARLAFGRLIKLAVIPNFMELPEKAERMKGDKYLLYIGRIHPIKAIENLIEAIAFCSTFHESEFRLKIAGDYRSEYGDQLIELATRLSLSAKIEFLGHIGGKQKQFLLANAHCTILPSHTENFGNVVVESLAQGTPVIASSRTPWQILSTKGAGLWVDNSSASLAAAIDSILEMGENDYQAMRRQAETLARDQFDINNNIGEWVNLFNSIAQPGKINPNPAKT